jgi:hypothetical protein
MSVSPGFTIPDRDEAFSADPQSVWMQTDIDALTRGIYDTGVRTGCAVTAQGTPDMSVHVAAGTVVSGGTALSVTSGDVSIAASDPSNPRVDCVVVDSTGALQIRSGTAAAHPKAPEVSAGDVLLAMVLVPAGASAIISSYITDKRVFLPDHGSLAGLTDDDHTQYALLGGRSGGQTLIGDTLSGGNLMLQSTAHASRGAVGIVDNAYSLGYLRVGSASVPANTGAGDLTVARLSVGNVAFATNEIFNVSRATFVPPGSVTNIATFSVVSAPDGTAGSTVVGIRPQLLVRPTANSTTADGYGISLDVMHDANDFSLGNLYGIRAGVSKNISGAQALANMVAVRAMYQASAGPVTNAIGVDIARGDSADAGSISTGIGLRVGSSAGVTPGTDIAIQTLGGHHRLVGGVKVGADATPARALDVMGAASISSYLQVGSSTTPANTAAGDVTLVRLAIGDAAFPSNVRFLSTTHTMTDTANGAVAAYQFQPTIAPTSNSLTDYRVLYMSTWVAPPADVTADNIDVFWVETRYRLAQDSVDPAKVMTTHIGGLTLNVLGLDSGSPATAGRVTEVVGILARPVFRPSGTSTVTVVRSTGISIVDNSGSGYTFGAHTGISIANNSATFDTSLGSGTMAGAQVGLLVSTLSNGAVNYGAHFGDNRVAIGGDRPSGTGTTTDGADGATALTRTMPGLELCADEMSTTNKYTAALKFMSTDSAFTTENPKFLAVIVGEALETYSANTSGGMALSFGVTPAAPGASTVPTVVTQMFSDGMRTSGYLRLGSLVAPGITAAGSLTMSGPLVATPSVAQNITAANTALLANASVIQLTANNSYTLTAAPTIADGQDGQILIIVNVDTVDTITLQDQGTLAGSNLRLAANTIPLGPCDSIILLYSATVGDWVQVGQVNVL